MSVYTNNNNIYENLNNTVTFANTTIKPNQNSRAHELKCVKTHKFPPHAFSLCKECIIVTLNYSKQLVIKR